MTTKTLNKTQLDYARKRVEEITSQKKRAYEDTLEPLPKRTELSFDEKINAIRIGTAQLKSNDKLRELRDYRGLDILDAFVFPTTRSESALNIKYKQRAQQTEKKFLEIYKQGEVLLDRLYFLGGDEALKAIEEFAKI